MATEYWNLIEPVWDALVDWGDVAEFQAAFGSTAPSARSLFAAHWLYTEVCNGGFHQFYWNSTGVLAPEAVVAYEAIGMPRAAEIIRRSMVWFPTPYPRERQTRIDLLDSYAETHPGDGSPFSALDDEFDEVVESESCGFVCAANDFAGRLA